MKFKCDNCGEWLIDDNPLECPFCKSLYCKECNGEIEEYPCDCGYSPDEDDIDLRARLKW